MDSVIRKISIGSDYKNDAMHYSVGQQVYGGHEIAYIYLTKKIRHITYILKKITRFYLGKSLMLICQYL